MVCSGCYTAVDPSLPWTTHTPQVCNVAKGHFENSEVAARCANHPDQDSPPKLLIGNICPTCSPNTTVRIIEPNILRNISPNSNPHTVIIYTIGPNSEVCNLIDPSRCGNNACLCKKPQTSIESNAQQQFWRTYTVSVTNSFDHNLSLENAPSDSDNPSPPQSPASNADPRESDVEFDSDDENYDAQTLVQCYKMRRADMFAYAIANPPVTVKPRDFLWEYVDEILHFMRTSETLRNRETESFKMWLWVHTIFIDTQKNDLEKGRDLFNKKKINTYNFMVPGFNGGLTKKIMENVLADLHDKFETLDEQMAGSGWAFQKCTNIKICMASVEHRLIEKTTPTGRILNGYVAYHQGYRGVGKIINFNYTGKGFRDKPDVCREWDRNTSPCVIYALKSYKIYHNKDLPDQDVIVKNLLSSECPDKYKKITKDAIRNTELVIPPNILRNGVELKDFAALENANKIPMAVYYIRPAKIKKKKDNSVSEDVTITCLRAPKPEVIKECGGFDNICYVGLISPDHVVLIPDMNEYMQTVFARKRKKGNKYIPEDIRDRRCPFCFGVLRSKQMVLDHVASGVCNSGSSQPPRVVMPPRGSTIKSTNGLPTESPNMSIILDMESRLIPPQNLPREDYIFDTDNIYDSTFTVKEHVIHHHVPQSVGMLFLNHKKEVIDYQAIVSDDVQYTFPDFLTSQIEKHSKEINLHLCDKAYLTTKQEKQFQYARRCLACNCNFKNGSAKHRHHDHRIKPVLNGNEVVTGNYIGPLCSRCNFKATGKRRVASCVMHNATNYDMNMLMKGLTSDKKRIKDITVLPKGNTGYINVKFRNASFIDSCSFIQSSLANLVDLKCRGFSPSELERSVPITVHQVGKLFGKDVTKYLGRKQVYPYEIAKCLRDLRNVTEYPEKIHFYNTLTGKDISDEDYDFGLVVWNSIKKYYEEELGKRMTLEVLHRYYLCSDVCLLGDVWSWYSELIAQDFQMDISSCLTGPSLVYKAALKMGETDLELLSDYSMFLDFEQNLHGGLVSLTQRKISCNTQDMGARYDASPTRRDESLLFLDWNSMYPTILTRSLPYGNFEYVGDIEPFKCMKNLMEFDTSDASDVDYFLIVDIKIPENVKCHFDDFPLVAVNCDINKPSPHTCSIGSMPNQSKNVKLISGHFDMKSHGVDLELLQFYISIGVIVTDVHRVIRYSKKPFFKPFIDHCAEQRMKNIDKPVLNAIYKLLGNSLYGKTIMDTRKYSTISRLCSEDEINKEISHPKYKEIRKLSKDCYLVTRSKEQIFFSSPAYIGTIVLQKAKLANLKLHYTVVKPSASDFPQELIHFCDPGLKEVIIRSREIIQSIYLTYSDTDSLLYHLVFKNKGLTLVNAFNETFLREFLDRSNFNVLEKKCDFRPGQYGKLKSEISDNVPQVAYFISPKVYSIELRKRLSLDTSVDVLTRTREDPSDVSFKRVAKGVDRTQLGTAIDQSVYRNVYEETMKCPQIYNCSFRFNPRISAMSTLAISKTPLSLRDDKRFWIDKDVSVAYGHELSFEHGFNTSDILCVKGGHIAWENDVPNVGLSLDEEGDVDLFNILCDLDDNESESESDPFAGCTTDDDDGPTIVFENESDLDENPLRNMHKREIIRGGDDDNDDDDYYGFSCHQTKKIKF